MPWIAPWECHCPCSSLPRQWKSEISLWNRAQSRQGSRLHSAFPCWALLGLGSPGNEATPMTSEAIRQSSPMFFSPFISGPSEALLALSDLCLQRELVPGRFAWLNKMLVAWIFFSCCFESLFVLTPLPSSAEILSINTKISGQRGISHHGGWTVVFPLLADCLATFLLPSQSPTLFASLLSLMKG